MGEIKNYHAIKTWNEKKRIEKGRAAWKLYIPIVILKKSCFFPHCFRECTQ